MELKGVSLVLIMVILLIAGNAIADDCYVNCTASCTTPMTRECFQDCGNQCSGNTGGLAQKTKGHHHHCKHRCSHHCVKYRNSTPSTPFSISFKFFFSSLIKMFLIVYFSLQMKRKWKDACITAQQTATVKLPVPVPSSYICINLSLFMARM